jgi:hypothetical protein
MALEDDVFARLVAQGVVSALGVDCFMGANAAIPSGDGPYISLISTGGPGPLDTHNAVAAYPRASLQVLTRATSSVVARAKAAAAMAALNVRNVTVGSGYYLWIRPVQSELTDLGVDERKRPRFAFNIETHRRGA